MRCHNVHSFFSHKICLVLNKFIPGKVNMVSRNQECSDDNGITSKSRDWSEKTLMIFGPILINYYLGRVNERKNMSW